ncbi:type II toxin-antitoxin system VapC family toxin [Lewinella sp. LCG006]|uniref:type II toxin-antitoxin system VapC family toxin n=1 Tax=Lewinella sp. LCG006 TaxID=3231911 RepID=UPI00345FE023
MKYLLDTNIVLIYTRGGALAKLIDEDYELFSKENDLYISVVTIAELRSFVLQRDYGEKKVEALEKLLKKFRVIDINIDEVLSRYAEIDSYSQGKLKYKKGNFTARNMGKNDLFIAATSSVYGLVLVTTDKDFNHLSPDYIALKYIDQRKYNK